MASLSSRTSPVEIPKHAKIKVKLRSKTKDVLIVYGIASIPQHPLLIPWCCLKFKDKTAPKDYHMVYHKLSVSRGETVESVVEKYSREDFLKALLVTANIEQKKLDMVTITCSFTVVIIPKMYKHRIAQYLQSTDESFEATIAPFRRDSGTTGTVLDAFLPKKPTEVTIFRSRMDMIIQERKCVSLVKEPDEEKRCLQWVMEEIDTLWKVAEDEMYTGWQDDMQEIMELLLQDTYFDTMFIQDFPFYFNLAYSLYKHTSQVTFPKNLNMFIEVCVMQISRFPVPTIVEKLSIFIEAGDFKIVFGGLQKHTTIFELTAESFLTVCSEFCRVSFHTNLSHVKLLSTSIALKFLSLCSKTIKTEKLWHKHFIEHYKSNGISHVDVNGLQSGLEAMTAILADHPNLMLSWKDVSCIFTSKVHSLTILKNFIAICDHYITRGNGDESFCSDYLKPVTSFYLSKVKKIEQQNSAKNETINEGLNFLSFLFNLIDGHQWSLSNFEIIFEQWLTILVNVIDLSLSSCIQCINILVNPVELILWEGYHECLNRQLEIKLKEHCHKMSVENFIAVVNLVNFEKSEVINNFLGRLSPTMLKNITITERPFKSLFTLAITHMTQPKHQEELLSFFKMVMECYRKTNRSLEFLTDLFQFNIHPSESFKKEFSIILKQFIIDHKLQKAIHEDIILVISKLSQIKNSFVQMTINTMIQEVFQSGFQFDHNVLERLSCFCLPDLHEEHIHSVKIRAIFSIFLIMARDMKLSSDNFHTLQEYNSIINPMAISFQNIWDAFKSWEGVDKEPTIEMFKTRVENIPEFHQFVNSVLNSFEHFVKVTGQLIKEKNITYDNLDALDMHFDVYEAMSQCISNIFSEVIIISKEELLHLKKCYGDYVDEIKKLLVKSPKHYPELAKSHVQSVLIKYGIEIPSVIDAHLKELLIPSLGQYEIPSTDGSQVYTVITYQAKQSIQLSSLESLKVSLTTFLEPLKDSLDTLVFVEFKNCLIFAKCINYFLEKLSSTFSHHHSQTLYTDTNTFTLDCQNRMIQLNTAVQEAATVVLSLIEGNARIEIIADIFNFNDLKSINLSVENESLQQYYKLKIGDEDFADISNSLIALLELYAVYEHIFALQKTLILFGLNKCLNDPKMIQLIEIAKEVDDTLKASEFEPQNTHFITSSKAGDKVSTIKNVFGVNDLVDNPCFNLFSLLQHGCPLYFFAQERGYNLSNGMDTFCQEYQLVIGDLLCEDHEELLAVLLGAMQLTSCFFNKSFSFLDLWTSINKISNISAATAQLKTVNEEIDVIRTCFIRTVGGQQSNENTLKFIICSGSYHFFCDGCHVEVKLQFKPSYLEGDVPFKEWSCNKVENFIRELSLFNTEIESSDDEIGNNFRSLRQINIAAMELQSFYSQLQYYGHPLYLKASSEQYLLYSQYEQLQLLKDKVTVCKKQLKDFVNVIVVSRKTFPLLSFVSTQKLKTIYANLRKEIPDFDILLRNISFLFNLELNSCCVLHNEISKFYQANRSYIIEGQDLEHPAKIIGYFLSRLISQPEVKPYLSDAVSPKKGHRREDPITFSLISAFDYSNLDLIRLIYWSFDKSFPLFCQLFRCSSNTCKEDIELFFDRIDHFPQPKYLVLGINLIRNDLQQVFLKRISKLKADIHKNFQYAKTIDVIIVEFSPSMFRHVPWIDTTTKVDKTEFSTVEDICAHIRRQKMEKVFRHFEIVCGLPGSGKTHYIKKCLSCNFYKKSKTICINETFNKTEIVQQLREHCLTTCNLTLFLKISLLWPQDFDKEEYKKVFYQLVDDVNWFFFDYFILGYVENTSADSTSPGCLSLPLVAGVSMSVYVEAPYWNIKNGPSTDGMCLDLSFEKFIDFFPVFGLLGEKIVPPVEFDVEDYPSVQLVCKYLNASKKKKSNIVLKNFSSNDCQKILQEAFPHEIRGNELMEVLYLKYMERRCLLLENCSHLQSTAKMRSTLFNIMKEEIGDFCKQSFSLSSDGHRQLIYYFSYTDSTFKFLCTHPEQLSPVEYSKLQAVGIELPANEEVITTQVLHDYISAAFNVDKTNEIKVMKEKKVIVTRDFVRKMLHIHERKECCMPVVIEGETGVGKTFLVDVLSSLWNESRQLQLNKQRENMKKFIVEKVSKLRVIDSRTDALLRATLSMLLTDNEKVPLNSLREILRLKDPDIPSIQLYEVIKDKIETIAFDPILASIVLPNDSTCESEFINLLEQVQSACDFEIIAEVLNGILCGCLKDIFYKLTITANTKSDNIKQFFLNVNKHADSLLMSYYRYLDYKKGVTPTKEFQKRVVIVFLDDIHTCSCPGYLKEIITDGTIDQKGQKISSNIFIVAACNPHRDNSLASVEKKSDENWFRSSYYVHSLPPTLELIMWDYGQLQESHEKEYIREKFILTYNDLSSLEYTFLTERIAKAQQFIRYCVYKTLVNNKVTEDKAKLYSQSTVSQRDIQRVFTFYDWLLKWFKRPTKYNLDDFSVRCRAVFVALALVYYFRLNEQSRQQFKNEMSKVCLIDEQSIPVTFEQAVSDEFDWVSDHINLPIDIATTDALKENIYAIIVCTMTRIPVIIVGPPGSSKTLSFKIVTSNFQCPMSKQKNDSDILMSLDPHFYHCSHKCTSKEIEAVFHKAEIHQNVFDNNGIRNRSCVFFNMDSLLKDYSLWDILHYYLDNNKVSFVGVANAILDTVTSNQAVVVYRSEMSQNDLMQIADCCLTNTQPSNLAKEVVIDGFVKAYECIIQQDSINTIFGVMDFIHFLTYIDKVASQTNIISSEKVVQSLEINFNGSNYFNEILTAFLDVIGISPSQVQRRSLIDMVQAIFFHNQSPEETGRNILLIDVSEDYSIIRLLFSFGKLMRDDIRVLACSKIPGDDDGKVNTIGVINQCAIQGQPVIILQAEEILDCLYDLLLQHFTCIHSPSGDHHYVCVINEGSIYPTRISPIFKCGVVVSSSEISKIPLSILNGLEKHTISHKEFFDGILSCCPGSVQKLLQYAKYKIATFVNTCGVSSFYGFTKQTIDSLMLSLAPLKDFNVNESIATHTSHDFQCECLSNKGILINCLLKQCHTTFGIYMQQGTCAEFSDMVRHVFSSLPGDGVVEDQVVSASHSAIIDFVAQSIESMKETVIDFSSLKFSTSNLPFLIIRKLVMTHLYKQLIQIMSPEALVLHREHMENYYISCYLQHQHHFSLGQLIQDQHKSICLEMNSSKFKIKKYLLYTQTSYVILTSFPPHYCSFDKLTEMEVAGLEHLFLINTDLLYIFTITSTSRQQNINQVLTQFFQSEQYEVLVLVANMNELNKDCISHVRLLIEEMEALFQSKIKANKLVYLLLHFPENMLYSYCYPCLFEKGWQHIYLAEVRSDHHSDIEECLSSYLLQQKANLQTHSALIEKLEKVIPVLNSPLLALQSKDKEIQQLTIELKLVTQQLQTSTQKINEQQFEAKLLFEENEELKKKMLQEQTKLEHKLNEMSQRCEESEEKLQQQQCHWIVKRDEIDVTPQLLGNGAYGEVRIAYFRGIQVAAKCLYEIILSPYILSIFTREMEIAARVRHPNLLQFIGATQEGNPIILSELMSTSVRKELEKSPLTRPQIVRISQDVCGALNYLHLWKPHPILHRDVSSANVLLEPSGTGQWKAKLGDYGSANFLHQISPNSGGPGSPAYSAPEAAYPDRHSPAMDVYSFGVLLMEMIVCQPPPPTTDGKKGLARSLKWLKPLVEKCIIQEWKRRPTIGQVLADLQKARPS